MYKLLILGTVLIGLAGCATTATQGKGWHPQSEHELRQIVGETMLMAMDQYEQYLRMLEEQAKKGPLKGLKNAPDERY